VIHPTVTWLAERIAQMTTDTPPEQLQELRDVCRRKIATFSLDQHMRLGASDPVAARATWDTVASFAAAGRQRADARS
jgi:hypothetical protein